MRLIDVMIDDKEGNVNPLCRRLGITCTRRVKVVLILKPFLLLSFITLGESPFSNRVACNTTLKGRSQVQGVLIEYLFTQKNFW